MSDTDVERDLSIRSGIQRKRLRCLLDRMERDGNEQEPPDRMDTNQVMLWLDMVGLPQFRDLFAECRMDGHLLLALTAQDLLELGIYSALNHASLARGIQFLRSVDFHLHRVERHFLADALARSPCPNDVERWSHGCTLEWLCSVDLVEFTPNLVFSGVHGALMVLEPTFTAESLADMLQIPVQKTLLRRHLTNQFNGLLGQQVIARKREMLAQPGVTQLTPSLRIRLARKGFSLTRKKSRSDVFVEPEWRVCPPPSTTTMAAAEANHQQANAADEVSNV